MDYRCLQTFTLGVCVCVWNRELSLCSVANLAKTNENCILIWKEHKQRPHFLHQFTPPITQKREKDHIFL